MLNIWPGSWGLELLSDGYALLLVLPELPVTKQHLFLFNKEIYLTIFFFTLNWNWQSPLDSSKNKVEISIKYPFTDEWNKMWQLLTVNSGYGGFGENLRMACQAASVGYTRAGTVCVGADAPLCWLCFLLIAADFRAFSEQWWSWIDQTKISIHLCIIYIHY